MKNIVVTGGSGLVGSRLKKYIPNATYISSKDYDLTKEDDVYRMFLELNPSIIIHLAAKVGGIIDNINKPEEYLYDNVMMNTLLVKYSYKFNVDRFIGILSTCIYPDVYDIYPMIEEDLHKGEPTKTNFSYGYAKRMMATHIDSCNQQYNTKFNYLIPCNLYGIGDKIGTNSHYVTALLDKIRISNDNNYNCIELYGDGTPIRQFMYVDDLCEIIKYIIDNKIYDNFNVAPDEIYTIDEIAKIAIGIINSNIEIKYNKEMPNGQYRKDVSNSKLRSIIKDFKFTSLEDGIKKTYFIND